MARPNDFRLELGGGFRQCIDARCPLPDPNLTTGQDMLALLAEELDAILKVIGSLRDPHRIAEILDHPVKASALATVSRPLLAQAR